MKREAYKHLLSWKLSPRRKPLIVHGARQVGKTWLISEFGRNEFEKFVYVNCENNQDVSLIFSQDYNPQRIVLQISALTGIDITAGNTLLFIDEVQECPAVVTSLKYFCENMPELHVVVAGSLLGLAMHAGFSFPVGKVDTLFMYPMSFREFILAKTGEQIINLFDRHDFKLLDSISTKLTELLQQYFFVGGMPAVVNAFVNEEGPNVIRSMQNEILLNYASDFSKHASARDAERIRQVWQSIPSQLAKENKKFVYGAVRKGGRASEFEIAIQWLVDAGLVYKVNSCSKVEMPLKFYENISVFKLYMLDCGLFGALADAPTQSILIGMDIFKEYKGAFAEEFVLQQIVAQTGRIPFYYTSDNSRMEIDFVMQHENRLLPIEVKSGRSIRANSLHKFLSENPDITALRFSMLPYIEQDNLINVPLYSIPAVESLS